MKTISQRGSVVKRWLVVNVVLIALCSHTQAQQQAVKSPVIGYLAGSSAPTSLTPDINGDAFRQGLRDLGYVEGKNIDLLSLR